MPARSVERGQRSWNNGLLIGQTVVEMPFGQRPLRIHFDPDDDGAAEVNRVTDHFRADPLRRIDLEEVLKPSIIGQTL